MEWGGGGAGGAEWNCPECVLTLCYRNTALCTLFETAQIMHPGPTGCQGDVAKFDFWGVLWTFPPVNPYPSWHPWFSHSIHGWLLHSRRSSCWYAVGMNHDESIPWSGAAEASAIPGRLGQMSTESLELIRKGKSPVGKLEWRRPGKQEK